MKNEAFIISWVNNRGRTLSYILRAAYEALEKQNWKRIATKNLRRSEFLHKYDYSMYEMHGSPHLREIYNSEGFQLPKEIAEPVDLALSESLIDFALHHEKAAEE